MFSIKHIDWNATPIQDSLLNWSQITGITHASLRRWYTSKIITPCGTIPKSKGRPAKAFSRYEIKNAAEFYGSIHGWFREVVCPQCGKKRKKTLKTERNTCKDCNAKRYKKYKAENKDKESLRIKSYRQTPIGRQKLRVAARKAVSRRRALKKCSNISGKPIVMPEWTAKKKTCYWCGEKTNDVHLDHVVPLSKGGAHENYNIVASCRKCNIAKSNKNPNEFTKLQMELLYG